MKPPWVVSDRRHRTTRGFLLIEVMVAVFLSALVVVPLATCVQRGVEKAQAVANGFEALADSECVPSSADSGCAWSWGPKVEAVLWRPGPELDVCVDSRSSLEMRVGIWVEGWLLGEWEAKPGGAPTRVDGSWAALEGSELCVRTRETAGSWGPPWRTLVPDAYGDVGVCSEPQSAYAAQTASPAFDSPSIALHTAFFSAPSIEASWAGPASIWGAAGVVFFLPYGGSGPYEVHVGGEAQSWRMTEGRELDVYF